MNGKAESETPEVDALCNEQDADFIPNWECIRGQKEEIRKLARSLERRLALAQTEIKGHMRVEDDLRRDLADEVAIVNRVWKALGIETYDAAKPFAIDEHVTLLKARIAELGKALLDIALCRMGPPDQHGTVSMDEYGPWVRNVARQAIGEAAIDAALKSRA